MSTFFQLSHGFPGSFLEAVEKKRWSGGVSGAVGSGKLFFSHEGTRRKEEGTKARDVVPFGQVLNACGDFLATEDTETTERGDFTNHQSPLYHSTTLIERMW